MGNMKSLQFKVESAEKENQILGITLRQREAEVTRLRELARTLQASMARLLCDLDKDKAGARPGGQLTQAALDSYDKQLGSEPCPASTSIISYLRRLEMDQVIPSASDPPDPATSTYPKGLTSDLSDDFRISTGPMKPSLPSHSPRKLRGAAMSECSLIGDEHKPDETAYLPLASSPHKATFVPPTRLMCTPPQVCRAERDVGDTVSVFGTPERNRTMPRSLFPAPEASDPPSKTRDAGVPKPKEPPGGPPPPHAPPHHLSNLRISDSRLNNQSAFNVMSPASDWSMASFSTFTSHDEQDFRNGLAALDANIAQLQRTLQSAAHK